MENGEMNKINDILDSLTVTGIEEAFGIDNIGKNPEVIDVLDYILSNLRISNLNLVEILTAKSDDIDAITYIKERYDRFLDDLESLRYDLNEKVYEYILENAGNILSILDEKIKIYNHGYSFEYNL